MTVFKHELRQNRISLLIWTAAIAFLLLTCVFLFPEMRDEMEEVGDMFSSMGSFSAAFGMDRINFGTFLGYYGIECGNVLGLGGAFFAALTAASALAGEEMGHTADFLLTHPVSRVQVITEKLCAVWMQIILLNAAVLLLSALSILFIGEKPEWDIWLLLHLAYFLLQIEIAAVCFGISAFLRRGSLGIGLGIAVILYFLNIIANLTQRAEVLKYITPFGYAEGADIIESGSLKVQLLLLGAVYGAVGIAVSYIKYGRKDIR